MQQFHFVVGDSGLLSEATASEQAEWYVSKAPELDPLDFEAHVMVMRAFSALKVDTPFERHGGVTKARYNILRMLHCEVDHRKLMTDIVTGMNVTPTNISKLVDSLERDGFVRRVANAEDKRKVWVELLPAGADVVESTLPGVVRHVSRLWQGLSHEEKRFLIHLLAKLRLHILTTGAGDQVEGMNAPEPATI